MYSVTIIGPGRMGRALYSALPSSKYRVDLVVARDRAGWLEQNKDFEAVGKVVAAGDLKEIRSDIVLFTTQDNQIANAVLQIGPLMAGECIVAHTSGSLSSAVLEPLRRDGISIGSIHPLVSVRRERSGTNIFTGAYFCLEGDSDFIELANEFARDLGGIPFSIETGSKSLYHAAAVMACGHLVALIEAATRVMQHCVPDEAFARTILEPLIQSTVAGLSDVTFTEALTGPFARADAETISRHLDALRGLEDRQLLEIYSLLGMRSASIASENDLDAGALATIRRELMMAISNSE